MLKRAMCLHFTVDAIDYKVYNSARYTHLSKLVKLLDALSLVPRMIVAITILIQEGTCFPG